ncbi:uncharacterized protein BXIN_2227 [Babesia sp. Xinjiang]|uniref:uncharacterized protein n=1 Tax=Babesia sp. Xinjiang TaxID=462227 RepID=UPI000A22175A|nr:uncharacterized protein BXIN_2227 [Babesia sp. Xinjiang]ORM40763.1 hypothetical protein BXIN_2227 [Babesia sp. Xinjiang]
MVVIQFLALDPVLAIIPVDVAEADPVYDGDVTWVRIPPPAGHVHIHADGVILFDLEAYDTVGKAGACLWDRDAASDIGIPQAAATRRRAGYRKGIREFPNSYRSRREATKHRQKETYQSANGSNGVPVRNARSNAQDVVARRKEVTKKTNVDKTMHTPFLLRVYAFIEEATENTDHTENYVALQERLDSLETVEKLELYIWIDNTLRDLANLIKDLCEAARYKEGMWTFSRNDATREVIGTIHPYKWRRSADSVTLRSINFREWRARYMDNGIKKAKHFSCKRYREKRSFFLASVFMRALSEYHEVPSDDFIAYWALRTDTFAAFSEGAVNPSEPEPLSRPESSPGGRQGATDPCLTGKTEHKQVVDGLADTLTEYKFVGDNQGEHSIKTPCVLRHDSSGDILSETSREESDVASEASVSSKEESSVVQLHDDPRVKSSIFYDGDFSAFLQRQKLLLHVIEDLQTSLFVSKPSIDFVPDINLDLIEKEYIVLNQKLLGTRDTQRVAAHPIRPRSIDDRSLPAKRVCTQGVERRLPRPPDYTLGRVLKKCADCGPDNLLERSVHLQKLVNILGGKTPVEAYANEVLDGICSVKSLCAKTQAEFGPRAFYSPSLRHPIDSLTGTSVNGMTALDTNSFVDNTLYSQQNAFMMPRNITGYMTKQKDEAFNVSDGDDGIRLRMSRMSNTKLAHFVESLCRVNFDEKVIHNSLEQNAKECCDLRSLIQLCQRESEVESEGIAESCSEVTDVPNEYFTNTSNHVGLIDNISTTAVAYYKNRVLPHDAMDFYHNTTVCDYKKGNMVRMQGGGPLDVSSDTFNTFDNRRQNMSHYLEAISALEVRIRDIQCRSEKVQRALHQYSLQTRTEGVNDLQEVLSLETLLFVCDTLMETKRRLHEELRRRNP